MDFKIPFVEPKSGENENKDGGKATHKSDKDSGPTEHLQTHSAYERDIQMPIMQWNDQ